MENSAPIETIYRHQKRQEWGHAIEAWRSDDRIAFVFEDGKTRTFLSEYARFLEPVDRSLDRATAIVRDLKAMVRTVSTPKAPTAAEPSVTLEEQVDFFGQAFKGGFAGDAYQREHRGTGAKRTAKRHRDFAIALTKEALERTALEALVAEGKHGEVIKALQEVLRATDLAPKKEVDALKTLGDEATTKLAQATMALLFGEPPFSPRFNEWLRAWSEATGRKPSWEFATALPALVFPSDQIAVKASVFREQAKWMAPNMPLAAEPNATTYERLREMALRLEGQLKEARIGPDRPPRRARFHVAHPATQCTRHDLGRPHRRRRGSRGRRSLAWIRHETRTPRLSFELTTLSRPFENTASIPSDRKSAVSPKSCAIRTGFVTDPG